MGSHSLLLLLCSLNLVLAATCAHQCQFPAIFNFGDSNSDTGGSAAVFGGQPPPSGMSFFGHPVGRACDGRLVLDFIAERLGLPYVSAYLDPLAPDLSHGANFATSGATIRPQNTSFIQTGYSPISLNFQFSEFTDLHTRSRKLRGLGGFYETLLPSEEDFSKALYTFDIGQNDLTAGWFLNMTHEEVKGYIPELLYQYKDSIKKIYVQGGRYFWIHNTGPVGCLAYVLDRLPYKAAEVDRAGCATPYNEVAKYYNQKLKEMVTQLRTELPEAAFTYVDVYSLKYSLFKNARKLGFNRSLRSCCGYGGKYNYNVRFGCGATGMIHGKEVLIAGACEEPSKAIVWDGYHFTQAANKFVFDHIVTGVFSDPPTPLNLACSRME